jgi:general nucleoside transport system ATP-binding protein
MRGITKYFPGITANEDVDFALRRGEIHALLGENGAGKSTLMSILAGLYYPDRGVITLDGKAVRFTSPGDALKAGIAMIYQHFMLVEAHTVGENIVLGLGSAGFLLDRGRIRRELGEIASRYQLSIDPDAAIWQLSVGEQQRVEILKALYRNARILIMDEPTAVLTPQETQDLFSTLRILAEAGSSIVFISHKLNEIMEIAHRITVLKGGRLVGTVDREAASYGELARMMVGRELSPARERQGGGSGETVLSVEEVAALNERGLPALKKVSFKIGAGEVLGLAGVAGNGQKELAAALNGLMKIASGRITLGGREMTGLGPREIRRRGVAFIPEDRLGMGLVPNLPVQDNMMLRDYWHQPFSRGPFIDDKAVEEFSARRIQEYGIVTPRQGSPVRSMSGGNLQKILISREFSGDPALIVAVHPTRGLDVGAVEFVHERLLQEKARGAAIFLICEDLDELLDLSDRIAVIYEGSIMGIVAREEAKIDEIGLMMSGASRGKPS